MQYLRAPSARTKACRFITDHTPHSLEEEWIGGRGGGRACKGKGFASLPCSPSA